MRLRTHLSIAVALALLITDVRGESDIAFRADAAATGGGLVSGSSIAVGFTVGLPIAGFAVGPSGPSKDYIELAGFWRWGSLPLPVDAPVPPSGHLDFALLSAAPNPFGLMTTVRYTLPSTSAVSIRLFDLTGRLVRTLERETRSAGTHSVSWDGRDDDGRRVGAGIYFCRMEAASFSFTRRIVFTR